QVVEQVPGARGSGVVGGCDEAGPPGIQTREITVQAGERRRLAPALSTHYQTISVMAVLMPEPTPMQRTRLPFTSFDASRASVIGSEAGPTLPSSG
ncbi:MAG: hypothetical protein JWR01_2348, partial [Subtercola sp.]|nr:hypothetical protein [Subtercola sp.]